MDPAAFTIVRFAVSAIPFIPFVFQARGDAQTCKAGIELGPWVSLGYLMQALGLQTSDAGRASFQSMFTVVIVPLLDGSGGLQDFNPSLWTCGMFWEWMVVFPWIPALYSGIFSTGLCLWVEMAAMRDVSATETAIIYSLEPVWGAAFAWFLLGERWGATGWVGAALVLGKVLFTSAYPQASCRLMYTCLFLVCIIHVYFLFLSAGGSLTVQIFGSASPSKSYKDENNSKKLDYPVVSDEHNRLSASPVTVSSRKDRSAK
ncbi:hypothetical protein ACFX2I_020482 [Malus domestica]